jgi:hypothetical protein
MSKLTHYTAATIFSAVLLAAGCQQQQASAPVAHGEEFPPDAQTTNLARLEQSQAASGAVADGTLYACHFTGGSLNSLGTSKLDLILKGSGSSPVSVWLSVPDDSSAGARQAAVASYLSSCGLTADRFHIAAGGNPNLTHPAAQGLSDLAKTDASTGPASSISASANTPGGH